MSQRRYVAKRIESYERQRRSSLLNVLKTLPEVEEYNRKLQDRAAMQRKLLEQVRSW